MNIGWNLFSKSASARIRSCDKFRTVADHPFPIGSRIRIETNMCSVVLNCLAYKRLSVEVCAVSESTKGLLDRRMGYEVRCLD
jgi:hypothetical protein